MSIAKDKGKPKPQGKISVKKVLAGIVAGEKKKDIAGKAGSLAESTEAKCNAVTDTMRKPEYKRMAGTLAEKLEKEIHRLADTMSKRQLNSTEYKDLSNAIDKQTKLRELLTGGVTERKEISGKEVKEFLDKA